MGIFKFFGDQARENPGDRIVRTLAEVNTKLLTERYAHCNVSLCRCRVQFLFILNTIDLLFIIDFLGVLCKVSILLQVLCSRPFQEGRPMSFSKYRSFVHLFNVVALPAKGQQMDFFIQHSVSMDLLLQNRSLILNFCL